MAHRLHIILSDDEYGTLEALRRSAGFRTLVEVVRRWLSAEGQAEAVERQRAAHPMMAVDAGLAGVAPGASRRERVDRPAFVPAADEAEPEAAPERRYKIGSVVRRMGKDGRTGAPVATYWRLEKYDVAGEPVWKETEKP